MWLYGLAPTVLLVLLLTIALLESILTHTPVRQITPFMVYRRTYILELFLAPIGEELLFRLWLQTRFQQWFGKLGALLGGPRLQAWLSLGGAALCGLLFIVDHASGFTQWSLYGFTAWVTWLRYRHGSLGAVLIAHVAWDGTLGVFGILVLTHILK